jgi:UPF0716 protein FxsA
MAALLALIFFVLPIAEIAVLMTVGDLIGFGPTLIGLVALSVAGAVLAKRQGIEIWRRFRRAISQGRIPSGEIMDGMLVLLGGALLLTPGFITDILGMVLLIPASRSVVKRMAVRASAWWIGHRFGLAGMGKPERRVVKVTAPGSWTFSKERADTNGATAVVRPSPPEGDPARSATAETAGRKPAEEG